MSKEVKRYTIYPQLKPEALAFLPDVVVDAKAYDALLAERDAYKKDAERYRWLRNPDQDVALVLDKLTGHVPVDRFGGGGYPIYEYRAGDELDAEIDAALQGAQP